MSFPAPSTNQEWMILGLGCGFALAVIEIIRLRIVLHRQKQRMVIPVIELEPSLADTELYLSNNSACYAKAITPEDIQVTLDYGFKKTFRVRFSPIEKLAPQEKVPLTYTIFDGEFRIEADNLNPLKAQLAVASFTLRLSYTNMENIRYRSVIVKNKDKASIQELKTS